MPESYVGELLCVAFSGTPMDCVECNGQLLQIAQYQALFMVLGTTYGGDGVKTFAVPDMRGRALMGADGTHKLGSTGGAASHTLTQDEMAPHRH